MKIYISIISLIIGLYIIFLNNKIFKNIINIFNNDLFKVIILLIIVSISNKYKTISVLLSVAFISSLIYLNHPKMSEKFEEIDEYPPDDYVDEYQPDNNVETDDYVDINVETGEYDEGEYEEEEYEEEEYEEE